MKTSMLISAIAACALWVPVVSAQGNAAPAKPAMSMDMDKQVPQTEQNMKNLQLQMDKIHKTTDPKARRKLMDTHMQAMQENMKAMRGMGGPMMKGGGKHDGMMMGAKESGMKGDDMMEKMGKRMDMMQMMMEQMMQREQATQMAPPAASSGAMSGEM